MIRTGLLLLIFWSWTGIPPDPPSRNLIPSGDFEREEDLEAWRIPNGNVWLEDSISQNGGSCLHLTPFRGNTDLFIDSLKVRSGRSYHFSFWYKAKGSTGTTDRMIVELQQGKRLPLYSQVGLEWPDTLRRAKSWTYYSKFFRFEGNEPVKFFLHTSAEDLWIDNVQLKEE